MKTEFRLLAVAVTFAAAGFTALDEVNAAPQGRGSPSGNLRLGELVLLQQEPDSALYRASWNTTNNTVWYDFTWTGPVDSGQRQVDYPERETTFWIGLAQPDDLGEACVQGVNEIEGGLTFRQRRGPISCIAFELPGALLEPGNPGPPVISPEAPPVDTTAFVPDSMLFLQDPSVFNDYTVGRVRSDPSGLIALANSRVESQPIGWVPTVTADGTPESIPAICWTGEEFWPDGRRIPEGWHRVVLGGARFWEWPAGAQPQEYFGGDSTCPEEALGAPLDSVTRIGQDLRTHVVFWYGETPMLCCGSQYLGCADVEPGTLVQALYIEEPDYMVAPLTGGVWLPPEESPCPVA